LFLPERLVGRSAHSIIVAERCIVAPKVTETRELLDSTVAKLCIRVCKGHVRMTIPGAASRMRTKHLREQARACQARPWLFFASTLRVHTETYLYIKGLPEVRKPEYLEWLRFFIGLLGTRTFLESGENRNE
jgi:hypothetical protein